MDIGENLKYLRNVHNKTQQDIAEILKISRQAYTHYESNKREPDIKTLVKLADYYMVSLDMLVGRIKIQGIEKAAV
ncbi:helix-turn-helix domain-containing protein [Ruminiclostridium cellulolyticum]|uniref:Transcriptional regulator, XRE family n=1 Tax=Ruminiclostridium cellulolyticum (strain ATCC 35319 / DSM 5812 / JCM 6584 / H10) TaxID=394503 RepID=B8I2C4_RUMCH|nr:helix-turn-helix transcriptional regulator [Ruminiclostridium cellulolyticum]ACL75917.1 transcriptional regulator, XRE family [Ruminiclostridium cellulolyticum H10]ACL75928.1 transcriptional regulator, XRE family [Ruminiclostridium cellulolyticum H10]ACL75939.1 transcriptional regulator, XRE family [Ruminiclostridium cellulolyticum H10]